MCVFGESRGGRRQGGMAIHLSEAKIGNRDTVSLYPKKNKLSLKCYD